MTTTNHGSTSSGPRVLAEVVSASPESEAPGYADDKRKLLARLKRIEGQVRGIERMVDGDTYCIDVLTQVSAVTKALQSVAVELVDDHLRHCVSTAIASGDADQADAKLSEARDAIARLVKS